MTDQNEPTESVTPVASDALLCCPFCGGKAGWIKVGPRRLNKGFEKHCWDIQCSSTPCIFDSGTKGSGTKDRMITLWNRRHNVKDMPSAGGRRFGFDEGEIEEENVKLSPTEE